MWKDHIKKIYIYIYIYIYTHKKKGANEQVIIIIKS